MPIDRINTINGAAIASSRTFISDKLIQRSLRGPCKSPAIAFKI